MKKNLIYLSALILISALIIVCTPTSSKSSKDGGTTPATDYIIIDDDDYGLVSMGPTGVIENAISHAGYTGDGYINTSGGASENINWAVNATTAGTYSLVWRYSFGGGDTSSRDAKILINGVLDNDTVNFIHSPTWDVWKESTINVQFVAGVNNIRMEVKYTKGLPDIDYIKIIGKGLSPSAGTPFYTLTVKSSNASWGDVTYDPVQSYYVTGSSVNLNAYPASGYFFQSWTGDVTSASASQSITITKDTIAEAIFLPTGTEQPSGLYGYATVQDDSGTPFIVTGGSLGSEVTVSTLADLKTYLQDPTNDWVVKFSGLIEASNDEIKIKSNKTLLGVGTSAHLKGIELDINGVRNVIVRNVIVSEVVAEGTGLGDDSIQITNGSKNIWIDHCDLYSKTGDCNNDGFSDTTADKDYYDGLLDIQNLSRFITVSWTKFHNHYKVSLISSGSQETGDTAIRVTYHHNYFYNCGSRLPSIRFGKAHIFNNYYLDNTTDTGINSRLGAVVRVEDNYFENTKDPIGWFYDELPLTTGFWDVNNNTYDSCPGESQYQPTTSTGSLTPPYSYPLETAGNAKTFVIANAGVQ